MSRFSGKIFNFVKIIFLQLARGGCLDNVNLCFQSVIYWLICSLIYLLGTTPTVQYVHSQIRPTTPLYSCLLNTVLHHCFKGNEILHKNMQLTSKFSRLISYTGLPSKDETERRLKTLFF